MSKLALDILVTGHYIRDMSTTYLVHYSAKANADRSQQYDPTYERMDPRHSRLRPLCKVRGRKDVTSSRSLVTCDACLTKLAKLS